MSENINLKNTLNLPKTDFPMKANLVQREKELFSFWQDQSLSQRVIDKNSGGKPFYLLDGPPYANGELHLGHALNKILKDILQKYYALQGRYVPYMSGWDCHGLPIEHKILQENPMWQKKNRQDLNLIEIREKCREFAQKYIDIQKQGMKDLGIQQDYQRTYHTFDKNYTYAVVDLFADLWDKGHIYRNQKPIHWCMHCKTALAEAEIEYQSHQSPHLFVGFPVAESSLSSVWEGKFDSMHLLVWTTTPWTLPSNVALAIHQDISYAIFQDTQGGGYFILAKDLQESIAKETGKDLAWIQDISTEMMSSLEVRHPFLSRESKIVFGDHVEKGAGTGIVHIAPGHGLDDFLLGQKENLPLIMFVDEEGKYTQEAGQDLAQKHIFEAQTHILDTLAQQGSLFFVQNKEHSYPHCWRCHQPLIFRATYQWFVRIPEELKSAVQEGSLHIDYKPASSENRMKAILGNRPDWCISRQRSWGVPIFSVSCQKCGQVTTKTSWIKQWNEKVQTQGLDFWFQENSDALQVVASEICEKCGSSDWKTGQDILDVWFESGALWHYIHLFESERFPNMAKASVCIEGTDQFRGWYQSLLVLKYLHQGDSPFEKLITHGFVLDKDGRGMSKSLGNVTSPYEIIEKYGVEILRLWVVSQESYADLRIGNENLEQTAEMYRKIRNSFRFLLGNLFDYPLEETPQQGIEVMNALDFWMLQKLHKLRKNYDLYAEQGQWHLFYQEFSQFLYVDFSSFYCDIVKDLLYTYDPEDKRRRSIQKTMWLILEEMKHMFAPILSFTVEEVHSYQYRREFMKDIEHSYFLQNPRTQDGFAFATAHEAESRSVEEMKKYRGIFLKGLEVIRQEKKIGSNLAVEVVWEKTSTSSASVQDMFTHLGKAAADFLGVSQFHYLTPEERHQAFPESTPFYEDQIEGTRFFLYPARGQKCKRCWRFEMEVTEQELCPRCQQIVDKAG